MENDVAACRNSKWIVFYSLPNTLEIRHKYSDTILSNLKSFRWKHRPSEHAQTLILRIRKLKMVKGGRMNTADVAAEIKCLRRLIGMRCANVYDLSPKVLLNPLCQTLI